MNDFINCVVNALPGLEFLRAGGLLKFSIGIRMQNVDGEHE